MAETGQRVIKESLEQGVGPRSTYAGSRWMPWNRAMGGRPAGMAGQKIEEAADAIDNLVAQVGAFETPLQGTTTFLHDVLRSPGATRGLSLADELQLTNDYALKEALSNAEIVSGGLGPVFSRYMTVPGAKASTLKPTDVLGAKTLLPRDPGLTAGGEISLRQAINDKRYLEKRVIAPLYKQLRGGGPVQATSTLQIAKAIRDQLSDRIKQSLQLVETTNPQFKGLVAEYEKHNQNIQMLNYIDRLIVQSDPRILPQMALGFGAGTGAGLIAGADPGTSLLAGGAAATMLSPPLLSRTARSLYGLGKLPVAQTAVRGADVLSTRGTTPSGQQQSLQVPGQGQAVQTPFPGDPTSMASIMRRQLPEPTDPTVPPIYRYLTGNLP